jgi:glutathione S-transferase
VACGEGDQLYKLYGWKLTGSVAIEAAFAEADVPYELIPVNRQLDEQLSDEFSRVNPRQQLPALVLPDGTIVTEGAAMLLHIADAFPRTRLAPKPGSSARAQHDRWLLFFAVNVYEGELRKIRPSRYVSREQCSEAVKAAAYAYVDRHYKLYDQALGGGPYLFGQQLSMADIYVWMLSQWMDPEYLRKEFPKVRRLADAVMERPKIAPVHRAHFGDGPGIKS